MGDGLPWLLTGITAGTPELLVVVAAPAVLVAPEAVAAAPDTLAIAVEAPV